MRAWRPCRHKITERSSPKRAISIERIQWLANVRRSRTARGSWDCRLPRSRSGVTQVTDAAEIRGYGRIVDLPPRFVVEIVSPPIWAPELVVGYPRISTGCFTQGRCRAGLLVFLLRDFWQEQAESDQRPWGRAHGRSSGAHSRKRLGEGASVTCADCRAEMCTTELLSKLRCAECHQIRGNELYDFAYEAFLVGLGGVTAWLLMRLWCVTTSREAHERRAA
jgi:hypothetical protein